MSILGRLLGRKHPAPATSHRPKKRTSTKRKDHVVLRVEPLETRDMPSVFTVTSLTDGNSVGMLRYEIGQANADAARGISDTIDFSSSLQGETITLTQGELLLSGSGGTITIDGGGDITISGGPPWNANGVVQPDHSIQWSNGTDWLKQ